MGLLWTRGTSRVASPTPSVPRKIRARAPTLSVMTPNGQETRAPTNSSAVLPPRNSVRDQPNSLVM